MADQAKVPQKVLERRLEKKMAEPRPMPITMSGQQIQEAASAGLDFLTAKRH